MRDAPLKRLNHGGERELGDGDQGHQCSFLELADPKIGNFAAWRCQLPVVLRQNSVWLKRIDFRGCITTHLLP